MIQFFVAIYLKFGKTVSHLHWIFRFLADTRKFIGSLAHLRITLQLALLSLSH